MNLQSSSNSAPDAEYSRQQGQFVPLQGSTGAEVLHTQATPMVEEWVPGS